MLPILMLIGMAILYGIIIIVFFVLVFPLEENPQHRLRSKEFLTSIFRGFLDFSSRQIAYLFDDFNLLVRSPSQFWQQHRLIACALVLTIGLIAGLWKTWSSENDFNGFLLNLYTDFLSLIATYGILDFLIQRYEKREQELRHLENEEKAEKELRQRLIFEAGSTSNEAAKAAVHFLQKKNLLTGNDSLLKEANLFKANLEGAILSFANLSGADMVLASLKSAVLQNADLQNAHLDQADFSKADLEVATVDNGKCVGTIFFEAHLSAASFRGTLLRQAVMFKTEMLHVDLEGADLCFADLREANLFKANLQGASLANANLCGANLTDANLKNANIYQIMLDASTVFPDGNHYEGIELKQIADLFGAYVIRPQWEVRT